MDERVILLFHPDIRPWPGSVVQHGAPAGVRPEGLTEKNNITGGTVIINLASVSQKKTLSLFKMAHMNLQYISDSKGKTTGVFIPIKEWNKLIAKYKGIEQEDMDIPEWHKYMVRERIAEYQKKP